MAAIRVGAGISTDLDTVRGTAEAATEAIAGLEGERADLVVAFVGAEHRDSFEDAAALLDERFGGAVVLGCTAQGVIGGPKEYEDGMPISVLAAHLPETTLTPFALEFVETDDGGAYSGLPMDLPGEASLLVLSDPFSFPSEHFTSMLNESAPGRVVIGGVASGAGAPKESRLLLSGRVVREGAVGVAIHGRVRVEALVSQGCRPIGNPVTITRADRNIIFELAGHRPIDHIRDLWKDATPRDRSLIQSGLKIGRVVDEYKTEFERGDFLIRNVIGADVENGWVAVGDICEVGETVQFHVQDPTTADEDLRNMLAAVTGKPAGGLLFACNGRGSNMFDKPHHDASAIHYGLGGMPLAGFFANGEIGPVAGRNFLHAFTASVALLIDGEQAR